MPESEQEEKRLEFSIEMACLKEKILELPDGINTQVGNDGIKSACVINNNTNSY